ncbi:MAG: NADP-dependent oxidoreductase [Candidatus Eremiobacteraeota bacterium]|nr:NADP-dependent oxidoreductase [Candidatus Eremiobacteraeota bacterium]
MNTQIRLESRPAGEPTEQNFKLTQTPVPTPVEGEVLLKTRWLSLDPYMRGRMSAAKSYAAPVQVGGVMVGFAVSEVIESHDAGFAPGEVVVGETGWQTYSTKSGKALRKIDSADAPISYALGVLGMPGLTAYCALTDIGKPQPGESVVVSAAAGAVGSIAGQIAKIRGCRVVGIAGSEQKCDYLISQLGFDACINRRTADLDAALSQACPDGIDVYFDNTAGKILEAVMRRLNLFARIPLVGLIEQYNAIETPNGPNLAPLLVARAKIEGFLVSDHQAHAPVAFAQMGAWLRESKLRYKEDIVEGLERAPRALIGMLRGENFGKLLVRVS